MMRRVPMPLALAVSELVQQRKTMHERMMTMHQGMMGHMMGHMPRARSRWAPAR
jgi:hypothetical protein